ncbi:calcium-binding protein [Actinacidiphila sp. bgisy145]|uniref:calcium-binding protein n=1 Tax=Actinacidiphila sp. bgisy145 TaxID=3413792 RepID=UPI003EBD1667
MSSPFSGRRALRTASALTLTLGSGLAATFLAAGPASAAAPATAAFSPSDHAIDYTAAAGQVNKVTITATQAAGSTEITYVIDDDVTITAGDGCTYPSGTDHTKVSCTVTTLDSQDPYAALNVDLGDEDDTAAYDNTTGQTYYFAGIDLGAGKDTYTETGSVQGNDIDGGTGDDQLTAGRYSVVRGDDGNDVIHTSADAIAQGNNGNDTIYADGSGTSADGGAGNDYLYGGDGRQDLYGGDDNDHLYGGKGDDYLYGGKGDDVLYGNSGADTLYGNSGDDQLYGGPDTDFLSGGPGTNIVHQD